MLDRIPQRWLMAAVTIAAGLLAAWAARQHIQGRIEQIEADAKVATVPRLVAAYDLTPGTRLEEAYVAVRDIPTAWAPSDALAPEDFASYTYSVLAHPLRRGDPVQRSHLAPRKAAPLSSRVSSGRRAITIPVDDINSLSGMLQAGDLLDLYVSFEHGRRQITAPLLQGVLVLATGRAGDDDEAMAGAFSTITLDAGPEDAVKLVAARQAGRITAILRHHRDADTNATAARGDLAALLGMDDADDARPRPVPVLYGDRPDGNASKPSDDEIGGASGSAWFDADVPAEVVSAGRTRPAPSHISRGARNQGR
ncbi:Flp pilus assembly protein CpaB [Bordetella genomosp. 9]|uniref:Flp pilus assembly protein CpaB n=1 Tax=Bordetella genomosp. 9 TaxID=1416803 RepID=A0A261RFD0_9BORD|nr:Flp pilus assembly protein CpaB [Bordetella genomosp. 9]OZI23641.1 Flp pilus assembly protein CpaB [Bordetella genomosp. 9]